MKRVRYAETDKMGYLYYGHYAKYYEIGRVESLRHLGLSYNTMEEEYGVMLPVVNLTARYLKPAYYDELIKIRTILKSWPEKMMVFHHELYNDSDELINRAEVKLFFIEMTNGSRISCPKFMAQLLVKHFPEKV